MPANRAFVEEPLDAHLDQLGAYDRTFESDGPLRVRVWRAKDGTTRIRVGRWDNVEHIQRR